MVPVAPQSLAIFPVLGGISGSTSTIWKGETLFFILFHMFPATMDPEPLADIVSDTLFDFFCLECCVGNNTLFRYLRVKEEVW